MSNIFSTEQCSFKNYLPLEVKHLGLLFLINKI